MVILPLMRTRSLIYFSILLSTLIACSPTTVSHKADPEEVSQNKSEIVGGTKTKDRSANPSDPNSYVVLIETTDLFEDDDGICTGSLIKSNMVLTAAHCVQNRKMSTLRVRWSLKTGVGNIAKAKKIIKHESYLSRRGIDPFDIAVIVLDRHLSSNLVLPVSLPGEDFVYEPGMEFSAVGYGRTSKKAFDSDDSGILRYVSVNILQDIPEKSIFQIDQSNGTGVCSGDSGGPALLSKNNEMIVIGIARSSRPKFDPETEQQWKDFARKKQEAQGSDYNANKALDEFLNQNPKIDGCRGLGTYIRVLSHLDWIQTQLRN